METPRVGSKVLTLSCVRWGGNSFAIIHTMIANLFDSPQAEFPRCGREEGVMRNILIVAGGMVAVAAIAAGVYFGTRPPAAGPTPVAVVAAPDKTALLAVL